MPETSIYTVRKVWVTFAAEQGLLSKKAAALLNSPLAERKTKAQYEFTADQWATIVAAAEKVAAHEGTPGGVKQSATATIKRGHDRPVLNKGEDKADPEVAAVPEGPTTVAEYRGALEALGVEIPAKAKKAELVALYETAHAA